MEDVDNSLKKRSLAVIHRSNDNGDSSRTPKKRIRNHPDESRFVSISKETNVVGGVVESILSIPVHVLFRKLPENGKPLLSRSEASCLVQIHKLAHQMDILTDLSAQILHHQTQYRSMANSLETVDHPYLRPLLLLLRISATHHVDASIERIRQELAHIFHQLDVAANHLARYSEQNYTLADDIQEFSEALALQKRKLSELQDEVRRRIQKYFLSTIVSSDIPPPNQFVFPTPLREYCRRLFDESNNDEMDLHPHSPTVSSKQQSDTSTITVTKQQAPQNKEKNALEESLSSSYAVTSPEASPEPEDLTDPDHSQRLSSSNTPQASNLTKKLTFIGNALDEKENTPSQPSSSQNSASQSQPLLYPRLQQQQHCSVDDSFKSQAAAEVLSMLASTATKATAACWPPARTKHDSTVAESPSFL